jgi:4-hydroxybenzoyl-CoA thioesterase
MLSNMRRVRIEWGDCDPAGIVFYPRYIAMFDHSTHMLIERGLGMTVRELFQTKECDGLPIVETRARFFVPSRFGDDVVIETEFTAIRRTSFDLHHVLTKDGRLAVEGFETRVWIKNDPERPGRFKSHPIPRLMVARFSAT